MLGRPDGARLQELADSSSGCIVRAPVTEDVYRDSPPRYCGDAGTAPGELAARDASGITIARGNRTTSFTGITHHTAATGDAPRDLDGAPSETPHLEDTGFWGQLQAGASLGIVFHEILEDLDFQNPADLAGLVERKLQTYAPWREVPGRERLGEIVGEIGESILTLLEHPLIGGEGLRLADIPSSRRLNEARFLLTGSDFSLSALADIIADDPPEHLPAGYADRLRQLPGAAV